MDDLPIDPMDINSRLSKSALRYYLENKHIEPMAFAIEAIVRDPDNSPDRIEAEQLLRCCTKNYPTLLVCKLSAVFASTAVGIYIRDHCLNLVYELLLDFEGDGTPLTFLDVNKLGKNLFSRPVNEEIPENMFKTLSKVISRLAARMFSLTFTSDWSDLRGYISSMLGTSLADAVRIFQDLPVPLSDNFLIPLLNELSPRILEVLDSRSENYWVSAFGGSFALFVQLMHSQRANSAAENIMSSAVKSAAELVKDGKEDFVMRGLLNVEAYSIKHAKKLNKEAFELSTKFIGMINGISGIGEESKKIAGRITEILEDKGKKFEFDLFN